MLLLFAVFVIVVIVLFGIIYSAQRRLRKLANIEHQKLENDLQLEMLRSKIIPHFTKNVLSAIGYFAMTDKLRAAHYISVFSRFTELTLANADKNYITLDEEINYLQTYLELEKMRFGNQFDFKIDFKELLQLDVLILSMTLHTYCDNAIRHGLVNKQGNGLLQVQGKKQAEGILITIKDNGIGRKRAAALNTHGTGQGLKLIQQQIDFYNRNNEQPIWQKITDLEDENDNPLGTILELFIPYNYKFSAT